MPQPTPGSFWIFFGVLTVVSFLSCCNFKRKLWSFVCRLLSNQTIPPPTIFKIKHEFLRNRITQNLPLSDCQDKHTATIDYQLLPHFQRDFWAQPIATIRQGTHYVQKFATSRVTLIIHTCQVRIVFCPDLKTAQS